MNTIIIHVDMDAFFASVEVRDNPELAGKPLIVGALPSERGVVSTCSYEARKYGVRSAMSIKEAYRLCPHGVYMHPNFHKYKEASDIIRGIWEGYTDEIECASIDEGFLDVTGSAHLFGGAESVGRGIKAKILERTGLTCSVGIGYSMTSAKIASEERKPDGFFVIPDAEAFKALIIDRGVRVIYGIGEKTALVLQNAGVYTVRDIVNNPQSVINLLGNNGRNIIGLANGADIRRVTPYCRARSIGKETTFQRDITDFGYLRDVLLLLANELSYTVHVEKIYASTVTLKITYANMQQITRSKSGEPTNRAGDIYKAAAALLAKIERRPVRLAGISLSGLTAAFARQISLMDAETDAKSERLDEAVFRLRQKYDRGTIKTAGELNAEKRLRKKD